jgi:hypothetical protein
MSKRPASVAINDANEIRDTMTSRISESHISEMVERRKTLLDSHNQGHLAKD